jgi:hypothetical protein
MLTRAAIVWPVAMGAVKGCSMFQGMPAFLSFLTVHFSVRFRIFIPVLIG